MVRTGATSGAPAFPEACKVVADCSRLVEAKFPNVYEAIFSLCQEAPEAHYQPCRHPGPLFLELPISC